MNKLQPILELDNVTKSFNGQIIFQDINLEIQPNTILSIVGPSGIGKTTLLRTILGLEKIDSGKFLLNGKSFNPQNHQQNNIGVVFQDYRLFPNLSVLENIILAPVQVQKNSRTKATEAADKLLTSLGLVDKKDLYPYQLSGGQKQRVAIARALILQPKILCYDEPTSALDADSKWQVADLLEQFRTLKMTQLVVTHDLEFAQKISDKIFKLERPT
nr:ATP-binding cassette domain-containing protein [Bombilactobacillus bombi]